MISHKLVPVEPTDDFVVLGGERIADHIRCEFLSNGFTAEETQGIFENAYRTIVEEGPTVQGEPVGTVAVMPNGSHAWIDLRTQWLPVGRHKLYAAPQPTEQQPDVTQLVEALEWLRGAINCTPENDKHQSGAWISSRHPRIKQIDELLATHRKGGDTL